MSATATAIAPAAGERCANCDAALAAEYCGQCGQKRVTHHDLALGHFISHGVHELTHLESNRVFRTARDLFVPGRLTVDYVTGRRGSHINPLRLYLTISAVFFLFAWSAQLERSGATARVSATLERFAEARHVNYMTVEETFFHDFSRAAAILRFLDVAALAGFLALAFRRRRLFYVQHLIFALHLVCFIFVLSTAMSLLQPSARIGSVATLALQRLVILAYAYMAMRAVYGQPWYRALAIAAGVVALDYLLFLVSIIIASMAAMVLVMLGT